MSHCIASFSPISNGFLKEMVIIPSRVKDRQDAVTLVKPTYTPLAIDLLQKRLRIREGNGHVLTQKRTEKRRYSYVMAKFDLD